MLAEAHSAFPGVRPEVVEAYLGAPDNVDAEVVDGSLSLTPRPGVRHARCTFKLLGVLDEPDDWVMLYKPELHLGPRPDILVPDIAGWRRERLPKEPEEAAIRIAPDWVCEILSDRTEALDRGAKRRIYRREGVGHLWLCDPRIQTLEVYRLENGRWTELDTYEGDSKVRIEPFEVIEIDLGRLWRW